MEMETGRKKIVKNEEPTSNSHSGLATKLLHLWSSGLLSAVLVRELADLAPQEHAELIKLAEAGAWGAHTGNAHIQIMRKFWSDVKLPEPFTLKVRCVCVCVCVQSLLWKRRTRLPSSCHTLCSPIRGSTFSLGKGKLEDFWKGVAATGDDRLAGHPMCLEKHWKQKTTIVSPW